MNLFDDIACVHESVADVIVANAAIAAIVAIVAVIAIVAIVVVVLVKVKFAANLDTTSYSAMASSECGCDDVRSSSTAIRQPDLVSSIEQNDLDTTSEKHEVDSYVDKEEDAKLEVTQVGHIRQVNSSIDEEDNVEYKDALERNDLDTSTETEDGYSRQVDTGIDEEDDVEDEDDSGIDAEDDVEDKDNSGNDEVHDVDPINLLLDLMEMSIVAIVLVLLVKVKFAANLDTTSYSAMASSECGCDDVRSSSTTIRQPDLVSSMEQNDLDTTSEKHEVDSYVDKEEDAKLEVTQVGHIRQVNSRIDEEDDVEYKDALERNDLDTSTETEDGYSRQVDTGIDEEDDVEDEDDSGIDAEDDVEDKDNSGNDEVYDVDSINLLLDLMKMSDKIVIIRSGESFTLTSRNEGN